MTRLVWFLVTVLYALPNPEDYGDRLCEWLERNGGKDYVERRLKNAMNLGTEERV